MKRSEDQISINAPPDRLYEYVADSSRHGEWAGHGLAVTKSTEGPVAVGATFSTTAKQFGTQREQSTITEFVPEKIFAWDPTGPLGRVHHSFSLSEGPEGSAGSIESSAAVRERASPPIAVLTVKNLRLSRFEGLTRSSNGRRHQ